MSEAAPCLKFRGKSYALPGNRWMRTALGLVLIVGGILGFMPILGFWMLPLGLIILSIDSPRLRRFRRKATVALYDWVRTRLRHKS
jgi:hypothetical protein